MRRPISWFLLSLATTFAGLAVAVHVLDVVALDPGRAGRTVAAMLETDEGKEMVADAVSAQLRALSPDVSEERADQIAHRVAHDPTLAEALGGERHAEVSPINAALDVLGKSNPRVADQARERLHVTSNMGSSDNPEVAGGSANGFFSELSAGRSQERAHAYAHDAAVLATLIALALAGGALVLGPRRDRLLRRAGRWMAATSAVGLVLWLVLPHLVLPHIPGRWPVVLSAGLGAAGAGLGILFGVLFAAGLATMLTAYAAMFLVPVSTRNEVPVEVRRSARRRSQDRKAQAADVSAQGSVEGFSAYGPRDEARGVVDYDYDDATRP